MGFTVPYAPPWMWQTTTTECKFVITGTGKLEPVTWACAFCGTRHNDSDLGCINCGAQRPRKGGERQGDSNE